MSGSRVHPTPTRSTASTQSHAPLMGETMPTRQPSTDASLHWNSYLESDLCDSLMAVGGLSKVQDGCM